MFSKILLDQLAATDAPVLKYGEYTLKVQDCVVMWNKALGIPVLTTVANATWVRWECGAEVLIVSASAMYPKFLATACDWIDVMREDGTPVAYLNEKRVWCAPAWQ